MKRAMAAIALVAGWLCLAGPGLAEDLHGVVVSVHDGDTLRVRVACEGCPNLFRTWGVRLLGVDAPELRDKRPEFRALAIEARKVLAALCPVGAAVTLHDIAKDKYGGRLLARVECPCNGDVAEVLKGLGLAREYWGRGPKPW